MFQVVREREARNEFRIWFREIAVEEDGKPNRYRMFLDSGIFLPNYVIIGLKF